MKLTIPSVKYEWTALRGKLVLEVPFEYVTACGEIIRTCTEGLTVTVEKPRKSRTTGPRSQNTHFNGHIQQICMETGNEFDDVKMYIKRMAFKRGLPIKTRPDGSPVYSLVDGLPLPISEKEMSTIECGYCIDETHALAAEYGIELWEYE